MERQIIELIASDRIEKPLSSMDNKLRKTKRAQADDIVAALGNNTSYEGERVYANISENDRERARGMKEAIAEFSLEFPKYGNILQQKIYEKRKRTEKHLYFGTNPGCKLTSDDYMNVMTSLGLTEITARALYPDLMTVSRNLARVRDEKRSIIVGKYASED